MAHRPATTRGISIGAGFGALVALPLAMIGGIDVVWGILLGVPVGALTGFTTGFYVDRLADEVAPGDLCMTGAGCGLAFGAAVGTVAASWFGAHLGGALLACGAGGLVLGLLVGLMLP